MWLGFLMRESERTSTNGILWYILGVYPIDVATVAILMCVSSSPFLVAHSLFSLFSSVFVSLTASLSISLLGVPFPHRYFLDRFVISFPFCYPFSFRSCPYSGFGVEATLISDANPTRAQHCRTGICAKSGLLQNHVLQISGGWFVFLSYTCEVHAVELGRTRRA
ncbi:hypothetical protein C8R45DRAFT_965463 [Mycena sanguinolenta]|nr:hypothetical protein C8R45DRAFT_965463 [Mycena sanguinolenta]